MGGHILLCRTADLDDLCEKPPPSRWPVKLLPRFDALVLATKDKSWLIEKANYSKVWRPAAHVEAVLMVGGRIGSTWRYDRLARGLRVRISPFAPLATTVAKAAEREAAATANFLGVDLATCEIARSWPTTQNALSLR
ncbi:MAG: crosslink repair DNA glycosylase YcaQ family protein [Acidobacteriota bacterium]|nr:crosslink repair DNA glycosylase YcaQ family protein [Acidobacteriota bacterium]